MKTSKSDINLLKTFIDSQTQYNSSMVRSKPIDIIGFGIIFAVVVTDEGT